MSHAVKKQSEKLPCICDYLNYREYLKDYVAAKKKLNANFSYKVLSNMAGYGSSTLFHLIIQGKRNITAKLLPKFINALKLNDKERMYFENLVQFNQSNDPEQQKRYYEKLLPVFKKKHGTNLTEDQFKYLSNWYIPVIREMIANAGFNSDPKWIVAKLKNRITTAQAEDAIDLLIKLKLAEPTDDGCFVVTNRTILEEGESAKAATFTFRSQMIDLAKEAMADYSGETWKRTACLTGALTKKQITKLNEYLHEFRNKILHEFAEADEGNKEIYQLNFQLFSLTRPLGGEK